MTTVTRQPFSPLDGSRLQTLTSLKNRQNAIASPSPTKRKASDVLDIDDVENVDPSPFTKRAKGDADGFSKPSALMLTKSNSAPTLPQDGLSSSPTKLSVAAPARPRRYLQPTSPVAHLKTATTATPRTAPAGRSPTRGSKRIGILSSARHRFLAPPTCGLSSAAPFSLDAALKGTIPGYGSGGAHLDTAALPGLAISSSEQFLVSGSSKAASWVFDIHEDTPEQEMTNLLQHSTCTLDISSDDERAQRANRDKAEGKENVPPPDDVSQTTARRGAMVTAGGMDVDKPRGPLAVMDVADYLPEGVDLDAVVLVPADEHVAPVERADADVVVFGPEGPALDDKPERAAREAQVAAVQLQPTRSIDEVMDMAKDAAKAAVLQPIEGTGENFDLWESGSATDDGKCGGG